MRLRFKTRGYVLADWKFGLDLTLGKIKTLLLAQYGLAVSTGVLSGMISRTSDWLEDAYEDIKTSLPAQKEPACR